MSNIEFDNQQIASGYDVASSDDTPFFVRMMLKTGLVKTEGQANMALLVVAVLFIILTISIFVITVRSNQPQIDETAISE